MTTHQSIAGRLMAAVVSALLAQAAPAAVTAEQAKQLGATLTEFGADQAANSDGSIPAYTGGIDKVDGYDPKTSNQFVDPYKGEKPLYSVAANNMAQYEALLAPGTQALIKAYPGYRIDVYPSHRSMRYTPQVLQNTIRNATTVKLAGAVEGDTLEGADKGNLPYEGIPFPIPRNGYEVMWNHNLHFSAAVSEFTGGSLLMDSAGNLNVLAGYKTVWLHPWYDTKDTLRGQTFDSVFGLSAAVTAPPKSMGAHLLTYYPINTPTGPRAWYYTPGQRRVRPAPEFAYDIPVGGAVFWDEVSGFLGRMDRFDFKLVGKREMLVPYNVFGVTNTLLIKNFLGKTFINPDAVRWEKHRVWVVDSTRKPEASHALARRTFYIDEDCWCVTQYEAYDNAGKMVRVGQVNSFPSYATGGINLNGWSDYDLVKGGYYVFNAGYAEEGRHIHEYDTAEGLSIILTPQSIVGNSTQ